MRKTLLSLCAIVAMSAGLLAGPMLPARQMKAERAQKVEAVQLQPKALQAEQTATLQATELQAQHQNLNEAATLKPVQTGQMLRASKPQTKAAQRAGEAEEGGTVLTYVADSAMVNTVFKENADYTVKTTIKNDSTAAYTGKVCVQFYADIYGIGYYFPGNESFSGKYGQFATTIDEIEEICGFDLYANVPKELQDSAESVASELF